MKKIIISGVVLIGLFAILIATQPAKPVAVEPVPATPQETAGPAIVLQKDGLNVAAFGATQDAVIAAVTKTLGAPTKDTGMTSSFSKYGTCPGNEVRGVEWNNFYVLFGDTAFGKQSFFQYGYTDTKEAQLVPALMTPKGVTIGMTFEEIKTKYPNARLGEWLPGQKAITLEERTDDKKQYLGGTVIDNKLYFLAGGILCGE